MTATFCVVLLLIIATTVFGSEKLSFKETSEEIIGGFIIEDSSLNMRVDQSIRGMLEENKDSIVEKITLAIGEVGETNE